MLADNEVARIIPEPPSPVMLSRTLRVELPLPDGHRLSESEEDAARRFFEQTWRAYLDSLPPRT